uniref:Uncharacterized protein n=1 Tax=Lepeophtheirus salmonis TaxID=72036 RepID=A0A0K2UL07_LEPSM
MLRSKKSASNNTNSNNSGNVDKFKGSSQRSRLAGNSGESDVDYVKRQQALRTHMKRT